VLSEGGDLPPTAHRARLDALEAEVRKRTDLVPKLGMVLGSGLGGLADELSGPTAIPFDQLPGWPAASAPGHAGRLLLGRLEDTPVVMLQGRLHMYEGHSPGLVIEPVLLMGRLGAKVVVLTNAAGGMRPGWGPGTMMVISDHLNLTGRSPLLGPNDDEVGARFPDLVDAWDPQLRMLLVRAAVLEDQMMVEGVYAGLLGPNYETPAEVRMLHSIGADAVGMSTVMEAIAARWAGLRLCGVSLITNPAAGVTGEPIVHEEVLEAGRAGGARLARVLRRFLRLLAEEGELDKDPKQSPGKRRRHARDERKRDEGGSVDPQDAAGDVGVPDVA
jgi:purine-nucleoside phosphorylase